jgi:hypothetical protein
MTDDELFAAFRLTLIAQITPKLPIGVSMLPIIRDYEQANFGRSLGYVSLGLIGENEIALERLINETELKQDTYRTVQSDVQLNVRFRRTDPESSITVDWWADLIRNTIMSNAFCIALQAYNCQCFANLGTNSTTFENENGNIELFKGFVLNFWHDKTYSETVQRIEEFSVESLGNF